MNYGTCYTQKKKQFCIEWKQRPEYRIAMIQKIYEIRFRRAIIYYSIDCR